MHIYLKKTGLLFVLIFVAGQMTAGLLETGNPSAAAKPWYQRCKKSLIAGACLLVAASGLVYYDCATTFPDRVDAVVSKSSLDGPLFIQVNRTNASSIIENDKKKLK